MPPKGKVKEDKTFGMKNKNKSAKVQKFVQTVKQQEAVGGKSPAEIAKIKAAEDKAKLKEQELQRKKMEADLFKPAQIQKVPFGTDPKTVLCVFFKSGNCEKGTKCKFSHDRNVERKAEKVNLYEDTREKDKLDKKNDTMDTWDDAKLADVVQQNSGKQRTTTDIVCKFFIQAIEDRKYGWFWECPNGLTCMYRHALPPGFVLKSDKKAAEEAAKKDVISLEEFLEVERHKLKPPLTPVTPESFALWKKTRVEKKKAEQDALEKAKASQRAAGKMTGMSGKEMFDFGGELYNDDDDEQEDDWDISRMLARYKEEDARPEDEERPEGVEDSPEVVDGIMGLLDKTAALRTKASGFAEAILTRSYSLQNALVFDPEDEKTASGYTTWNKPKSEKTNGPIPPESSQHLPCHQIHDNITEPVGYQGSSAVDKMAHICQAGGSLDQLLSSQDPYRRIRYERPVKFSLYRSGDSRMYEILRNYRDAVDVEAHIVPFWSLAFLCNQFVEAKADDPTQYITFSQARYNSLITCSLAAVGEDHWCSGVVLSEDLDLSSKLLYHHRLKRAFEDYPSDSAAIYTEPDFSAEPFIDAPFGQDVVARFAYSYPRLTEAQMREMTAFQTEHREGIYREILSMGQPIKTFAFPVYRLVYQVTRPRGTVFIDGASYFKSHEFELHDYPGKLIRKANFSGEVSDGMAFVHAADPTLKTLRMVRHQDDDSVARVHDMLIRAMRKRPISAETWEDGNIFALDPEIETIGNYITESIAGNQPISQPQSIITKTSSRPLSTLQSLLKPLGKENAPPRQSPTPPLTPPPTKNRLLDQGKSRIEARARFRSDRAKAALDTQKAFRGMGPAGRKSAVARRVDVKDQEGYYQELGFVPHARFLEEEAETEINAIISERYAELAKKHHPDNGGDKVKFARLSLAKSEIARHQLRIKYQYGPRK
ncbi:hypothetical protein P7C73_g2092, partial [Tremellales sp. Uapishka_1]